MDYDKLSDGELVALYLQKINEPTVPREPKEPENIWGALEDVVDRHRTRESSLETDERTLNRHERELRALKTENRHLRSVVRQIQPKVSKSAPKRRQGGILGLFFDEPGSDRSKKWWESQR